jgi:2-polyprenyl-3-methyl-5-hydroxy-6-metoxy-1,4-benzoquinol methylase
MISNCRFCSAPLHIKFADLGMSPISNDYITPKNIQAMEPFYPLQAYVCENCFLVQLIDFEQAEHIFSDDYAYFSSYSETWLRHAECYAQKMIVQEKLGPKSMVVEIASNDGYLLQFFKHAGITVLGVEPTANTAKVALVERGVPSEIAFFGAETARRLVMQGVHADVITANNVMAHVPDINDFVSGFPILLKRGGVANVEFPHLLSQIENNQFDTIYHEHFSYLSFTVAQKIFAAHGMRVYDKEELKTHGGSLRLYICHAADGNRPDTPAVLEMLEREARAGLHDLETYRQFSQAIISVKCNLLKFLISARQEGKSVVGYGAPAKGNTLLNYCGIKTDLLEFTVDRSPHKVGKFLPGVRIPIMKPESIFDRRPDYLLILPWNIKDEIMDQMAAVRSWGCRFVTPIPRLEIF